MAYRYIGNKTRIAGRLASLVADVAPAGGRVADLMCGTASFSAELRSDGYQVIAADLMTYAYYHAVVRLRLPTAPAFRELGLGGYGATLDHLNSLSGREGLMYREYSPDGTPSEGCAPRKYFTPDNATRIDHVLFQLASWKELGLLRDEEHALLRHDLVLAVNRVANIAGTYGHYWSKWTNAAQQPLALRPSEFSPGRTDHEVFQGQAEDLASQVSCDVCYLDPPYTKRQYAANYHIIETVARGDEPEAIGASGLRPWRDQYSDFCSKVRIRSAFEAIITGVDAPVILISYSEDGLLARDEMIDFLEGFGGVTCFHFSYPRFRSNQSPLPRELSEYVFAVDRLTARPTRILPLPGSDDPEQLFAA